MKFSFNTEPTGTVGYLHGGELENMNICGAALLCLPGSINRNRGESIFNGRRIVFLALLMMIFVVGGYAQLPKLGDYQSVNSGNWDDLANWERFDGNDWITPSAIQGYPGENAGTGDVTIQDGTIITINISPAQSISRLFVGKGISGILQYDAAAAQNLWVSGIVTINHNGVFRSAQTGTVISHQLIVDAGIVNEGTLDFSTNTAGAGITFSGNSNGLFDLSAATLTNLMASNGLVLNKGDKVLSFKPGGIFQVLSGNSLGFLTIQSGTFSLMGENTFSNPLFFASDGSYTIPAAGGFWLDNSNATIIGMYGTLTNNGEIIIRDGIYNIGTSTGNESLTTSSGRFEMNGGTMNISGRFRIDDGHCTISGGTLNLATFGHANRTLAAFHISASANLTMSGDPLVTFAYPNSNPTPFNDIEIEAGGIKTITGGTFQMGTTATPPTKTFLVKSDVPIYNLLIYNANTRVSLSGDLTVNNQLTLNGRLSMINYNLTIGTPAILGDLRTNHGMIVTGTGQVNKTINATGSYLFPFGTGSSSPTYIPVILNFNGGAFSPGASVKVGMVNSKHPQNLNTTNYIKRYWSVQTTGITNGLYNFTGTYATTDIAGEDSYMTAGVYTTVWEKIKPSINGYYTINANGLTGNVDITGINAAALPEVTVSATPNSVCSGTPVQLTANVTGVGPFTYSWTPTDGLNDPNIADPVATLTVSTPTTIDYKVTVTDGMNESATGSVTVTVNPVLPVGVSITTTSTTICEGTSVTFTATPTNGGTAPVYQWILNGANVGSNSTTYTNAALANGDIVTCILTSNETCATGNPATSNALTMTVSPNLPVGINISTTSTTICEGTSVTFTATPTNGGTAPVYQWRLNGANVGSNSMTYTNAALANGDVVACDLTTNVACATGNPATSNELTMTVSPNLPVGISISTTSTIICEGTSVTFIATPTTGGTAPVYQWRLNGADVGSNSTTYTNATLANGDIVTCILTSNETCATGSPATSNTVAMIVNPDNTISLSSAPGTNAQTVCINTPITPITYTTTGATGVTVTNLPTGVTSSWAGNVVTISGTPTVAGPALTYTVTLTGGCGTVTATGTITVSPNNTIVLSSGAGTNNQVKCINTSITSITYTTTGATGATVTNLPAGVTSSWAGNVVTISGTPTVAGPALTYTVTLTGGCGATTATGTITVSPDNTITLSSALGTDSQTQCINTPITPITYTTTGATGATFGGLPAGVTGNWAANTVTISGAPAAVGTFSYTVTLLGGCGVIRTTGSITVTPNNTIALSSAPGTNAQTLCINNAIIPITYTTTGATGATFSGLPAGVTGSWADNVVTINGIPTVSGPLPFTYRVTLTGGCGVIWTTGTIFVKPNGTIVWNSSFGDISQTVCINTGITQIRYNTTGATGATVTGLPDGVSFNFIPASNQVRINGTPTVSGIYNYTISLTGACGNATAYGTITINPAPTLTSPLTATICSSSLFSYDPQSDVTGTTFNWSRAAVGGISPGANFGTGNPNETLFNSTVNAIDVRYHYTLLVNGCSSTRDVVVTVLPGLVLTNNPTTPSAICSNSLFTYIPTARSGVTIGWRREAVIGIDNLPSSGTGTINETLVNLTAADVFVPYIFTLTEGSCSREQIVNLQVKPSPTLSSPIAPPSICNNTAFTYTPTSLTGGTILFSWIRNAIPGISNAAATGTNGITETLINTTTNPIAVTYIYTLRANNCNNVQNVVVTVNPTPTLSSSHTPPAVCSNSPFNYTPNSLTPLTTYSWTCAPVAGISSHLTSGTGNINETLVNTTTNPISVRYVYTLSANGCTNTTTENVDIIVNPLPTVTAASVSPNSVCGSGQVSFTATASAGTIKWYDAPTGGNEIIVLNPTISSNTTYYAEATANGCVSASRTPVTATVFGISSAPTITASGPLTFCSGGSVTLTSSAGVAYLWSTGATSASINVSTSGSYTVRVTDGNGCQSAPSAPTVVTVNPLPTITISPSSPTICAGSGVTLTASGAVSYVWDSDPTLSALVGATVIASPLTTTTYRVTGTDANSCTNTQTVVVTVKPQSVLTNPIPNPGTVCSNTPLNYTPIPSISGTICSWTRVAVPGISPATSSGTGSISETLTNSTGSPIGVNYAYTLTVNGCTNPIVFYVAISVIPAPTVTAAATPTAICEGGSTLLTSTYSLVSRPPILKTWNFNGPEGWTPSNNNQGGGVRMINSQWTPHPDGYLTTLGETIHSNDNSQFYLSDSNDQGSLTRRTETYLTSPPFSTVGYTTLSLSFWHYYYFKGVSGEFAYVQVSTDGNSWVDVYSINSTQGAANGFVNSIVNLNFYINKPAVYIRFKNYSLAQARYWAIDNVQVTGTSPDPDISWSSIPAGYSSNVANPPAVSPAFTTTYTVTYSDPTADPGALCSGSGSVTVTVNPKPTMTSANTATICSGGTVNIPLTGSVPSTYTWLATDNPNVTGESLSLQTTGTLNNTLINTSSTVQVVNYTVTPIATAGSCVGTPQTVSVTVNPAPTVSNASFNQGGPYCNGNTGNSINFTSNVPTATYSWTSTANIGFGTSGVGNIPVYIATNTTTSPVTTTVSVSATADGCPGPVRTFTITVNPTPAATISADYCIVPGKIRLTATGGGTYSWIPGGQTTSFIDVDVAGNYGVTVTNLGCSQTVYLGVADEKVVNGNFSAGNTGFTSGYAYKQDVAGLVPAGQGELYNDSGNNAYSITTNGQNVHINFWGRDHTTGTGNFMAVNGHGTYVVWSEGPISVVPGTTYYFSAWAISLNSSGNYANLSFAINGSSNGLSQTVTGVLPARPESNGPAPWIRFYGNWTAPAGVTSATLSIVDLVSALSGNDFGLDDISFGTLAAVPSHIDPQVVGGNNTICEGTTLRLTPTVTGGKKPYTFTWTGPNGFTSADSIAVIPNATSINAGTYTVTVRDGYGCGTGVSANAVVVVNALPVCSITGATTVCPGSTGNTYTAPAGMTGYEWTISGGGTIVGSATNANVTVTAGAGCNSSFTLSLKVTNGNNCSSTCTQLINVQDNTAPIIVGTLTPTTIQGCAAAAAPAATTVAQLEAMAGSINITDACTSDLLLTVSSNDVVSGTCPILITRTYTIRDACNNSATINQVITVQDTNPPVVTGSLTGTTVQGCTAANAPLAATTVNQLEAMTGFIRINDACTAKASLTVSHVDVSSGTCPITVTRTYTVRDACNNSVPIVHVITIQDTTPPVVVGSLTGTAIQGCTANVVPIAATTVAQLEAMAGSITINDACTPKASLTVSHTDVVSGACPITITRTYTVRDACNNSVPVVHVITIQDTTAPIWITPAGALNEYLECGDAAGLAAAQARRPVATDNCDLSLVVVKQTSGPLVSSGTCSAVTYTNTYRVTDACGNQVAADYTQIITIEDNSDPVILVPPTATLTCLDDPMNLSITGTATATDNCDSAPVITHSDNTIYTTCAGDYKIERTWTATDACGHASSAIQDIFIQDVDGPVISVLPGPSTIDCQDTPVFAVATAYDACASSFTLTSADHTTPGTCANSYSITRTWTATDACNNVSTASQTINVQDIFPPVISGTLNPIDIEGCEVSAAPPAVTSIDELEAMAGGIAVSDACTSVGALQITSSDVSSGSCPILLTRTYTITDACDLSSTITQRITIRNTTATTFTFCPPSFSTFTDEGEVYATLSLPNPVYNDGCGTPVSLTWSIVNGTTTRNGIGTIPLNTQFQIGTNNITYTATNACGNFATCNFTVTVSPNDLPVITCPSDLDVPTDLNLCTATLSPISPTITFGTPPIELGWTIEHPVGTIMVSGTGSIGSFTFNTGTTLIHWTASNIVGSVTCTQTITVTDRQNPVITCPATPAAICANSAGNYTHGSASWNATATDNCSINTITYTLSGSTTGTGSSLNGVLFNSGNTTVVWRATDIAGNFSECTFQITINPLPTPSAIYHN